MGLISNRTVMPGLFSCVMFQGARFSSRPGRDEGGGFWVHIFRGHDEVDAASGVGGFWHFGGFGGVKPLGDGGAAGIADFAERVRTVIAIAGNDDSDQLALPILVA